MWTLIFLALCAYIDLKQRELPAWLLGAALVLATVYRVWFAKEEMVLWIGGAAVGAVFLMIGRITGEALGYGDGFMILILGICTGLWNVLWLLSIAFVLSGVFSVVLLLKRRGSKKTAFPFVPFLLLGYVGVICL